MYVVLDMQRCLMSASLVCTMSSNSFNPGFLSFWLFITDKLIQPSCKTFLFRLYDYYKFHWFKNGLPCLLSGRRIRRGVSADLWRCLLLAWKAVIFFMVQPRKGLKNHIWITKSQQMLQAWMINEEDIEDDDNFFFITHVYRVALTTVTRGGLGMW